MSPPESARTLSARIRIQILATEFRASVWLTRALLATQRGPISSPCCRHQVLTEFCRRHYCHFSASQRHRQPWRRLGLTPLAENFHYGRHRHIRRRRSPTPVYVAPSLDGSVVHTCTLPRPSGPTRSGYTRSTNCECRSDRCVQPETISVTRLWPASTLGVPYTIFHPVHPVSVIRHATRFRSLNRLASWIFLTYASQTNPAHWWSVFYRLETRRSQNRASKSGHTFEDKQRTYLFVFLYLSLSNSRLVTVGNSQWVSKKII